MNLLEIFHLWTCLILSNVYSLTFYTDFFLQFYIFLDAPVQQAMCTES